MATKKAAKKKTGAAKKPSKALQKNKEIVRRWADEVFNKHNLDYMSQGYDEDYINFNPYPGQDDTIDPFRELMAEFLIAYPDMHVTIDDLIADGNMVVSIGTFTGTNNGPFMGIPPTGQRVISRRVDVFRFSGSKIIERSGTGNDIPKLRVVGAVQPTKPAKDLSDDKAVARHFAQEVFGNRSLSAVDELVDDYAEENARASLALHAMCSAFTESAVATGGRRATMEGKTVSLPLEFRGRHSGQFMGMEATNIDVTSEHTLNVQVESGRVVSGSYDFDLSAIAQQLGK
jgi:predicted ester cyclase